MCDGYDVATKISKLNISILQQTVQRWKHNLIISSNRICYFYFKLQITFCHFPMFHKLFMNERTKPFFFFFFFQANAQHYHLFLFILIHFLYKIVLLSESSSTCETCVDTKNVTFDILQRLFCDWKKRKHQGISFIANFPLLWVWIFIILFHHSPSCTQNWN